MDAITIDDFILRAKRPGSDAGLPPILLVHGLWAGAWSLEPLAGELAARGFPAYALALSGREGGRPADDVGRLTLEDFAEDTADALAWMAREHGQTPALLGHSMGGLVAQMVAARVPLAALVLVASAPPRGIPLVNPRLLVRQLRLLPRILRGQAITPDPADLVDVALNRVPGDRHAELLPRFVADSGRVARDITFGRIAVNENLVQCPVLCVTGEDDRLIPPKVTRRIAARYHAPVWTYPGRGHFIVCEPGNDTLANDLAGWLRHVALMAEQPARVEDLWTTLQASIGEVVDLSFFDGRIVRAEMVNVDLAVRRNVVYRLLEVRQPGSSPTPMPAEGDVARAALHELSAVTPVTA